MISYAQNFEDVMLARAFGDRSRGFYVDIGAFLPDVASVTRHFYDLGWNGINVEPMEAAFAALAAARDRDINVRAAIAAYDGELAIYSGASAGESSALRPFDTATPTLVPCMTLASLCRAHVKRAIDFMKIDVEGLERDVLMSGDWTAFRPAVVLVEITLPWSTQRRDDAEGIGAFMRSHGYDEVYFDGLNAFYLAQEAASLASRFAAPPNVLDRFTTASEVEQRTTSARLQAHAEAVEKRLAEVQAYAERERTSSRERLAASERAVEGHASRLAESQARLAASENALQALELRAGQARGHLLRRLARVMQASEQRIAHVTALSNARVARILRASARRSEALEARMNEAFAATSRAAATEAHFAELQAQLQEARRASDQATAEFHHAASVAGQLQAKLREAEIRERAVDEWHRGAMQRALQAEHTIASMLRSRSWRITAPLRSVTDWFRGEARSTQPLPAAPEAVARRSLRAAALRRGRVLAKRTPLYQWLAPRFKARYPALWARARAAVVENPVPRTNATVAFSAGADGDAATASARDDAVPSVEDIAARLRREIARRRSA